MGFLDVALLATFGAAAQQDNAHFASRDIVHPVAGTFIYPQLEDPFANRSMIAEIATSQPFKPTRDLGPRAAVTETGKPKRKSIGLKDLVRQVSIVSSRRQIVNSQMVGLDASEVEAQLPYMPPDNHRSPHAADHFASL